MTVMQRVTDGFRNLVANIGTSRDKAFGNSYVSTVLDYQQLTTAYEVSSVAKAIIDMPAEDACREWREWQAKGPQITLLEAEEKRLNLRRAVMDARIMARLYGGAAIYIGTRDNDLSKPLDPSRIGQNGIRYLTVLDRTELTGDEIQRDPRLPGFGLPSMYRMTTGTEAMLPIHPSRLVIFTGPKYASRQMREAAQGWGDSVLTATLEKIQHLDATVANIASLVFEAKVDVIKIKDFTESLRSGGTEYENLMLSRFQLAATAKGINGALLLDSEEEYDQKSANFSTLPEIIDRFMQVVSGAARIPVTRLFGTSPGGMNATGESDMRNYYDAVKQQQTLEIEPALGLLDECLIRSALGNRPDSVWYSWKPLWQPTAKERAENADKITTSIERLDRIQSIPEEALVKAAVNALTETGAFPGLEAAMDEFYSPGADDLAQEEASAVSDASPRTLYVRRDVLNSEDIIAWAREQGFTSTLPADDMHVTIAFSRDALDWMKVGESWQSELKVAAGGPRMMERFGDARVLLFASSELSWRHHDIRRAGASWDHPEYQPHITISYADDAPDLSEITPYTGEIILGPEIFEEVNPKWMEGIKET